MMKNRPIHENLDTSFVNLPALVRYLRRRQFVGLVRVELSGYEADIRLLEGDQMSVREHDHIAGRVAEGEEAFQRILIRSREPGGIINVFQTGADTAAAAPDKEVSPAGSSAAAVSEAPARVRVSATNGVGRTVPPAVPFPEPTAVAAEEEVRVQPKSVLPNLPFEFSNRVEEKARPKQLSAEDRKLLVNLIGEILSATDECLSKARLDFAKAYQKACSESAADFPFLLSLDYGGGKLRVSEVPGGTAFVTGTLEALRRILEKLAGHPKFAEVHRFTAQRLLALAQQRKAQYEKFAIAGPLRKAVGV